MSRTRWQAGWLQLRGKGLTGRKTVRGQKPSDLHAHELSLQHGLALGYDKKEDCAPHDSHNCSRHQSVSSHNEHSSAERGSS